MTLIGCRTPEKGRHLPLIVNRDNVYRLFKYAVYGLLALNVYLFFAEE